MIDADLRRKLILDNIKHENMPISATALAKKLNVSRQVIVGDVALLRAQGHEIIATARGYISPHFGETNQYVGKIICRHSLEDMVDELYAIVDLGAVVVNVIVEHELYGEITGNLNLSCRRDVDDFISKVDSSEVKLLSELTMGVHTHTVSCRNREQFEKVCNALAVKGMLLSTEINFRHCGL